MTKKLMSILMTMLIAATCFAQTNPVPRALPYTTHFNGLAHTSNNYPGGWRGWRLDAPSSAAFNVNAPIAPANKIVFIPLFFILFYFLLFQKY